MEFEKLIKDRYSVRKFKNIKIEQSDIDKILAASRLAPTACNNQPQRLLVLNTEESLAKLKKATKYHFEAPLAIIVACDKSKSWVRPFDNNNSYAVDASIIASHIMLTVADIGLGTTWIAHFNPDVVKEEFNFPGNIEPIAIFPIGYPADDASPSPKHSSRLELAQTVKYNSF